MYFKKYLIVIREKKKEEIIAKIFNLAKSWFSEKIILFNPKTETAPKIGIDIKKDILAESTLLNPKNLEAVIAIPDLLTPGINAKICKDPIKIADLKLKFFLIVFSILNLSLINNKIPKIKVVQAITWMFLIFSIIFVSIKIKPTNITGTDDIKILKKRILFL